MIDFFRKISKAGREDAEELRCLAEGNFDRFEYFEKMLDQYEELDTLANSCVTNNQKLANALGEAHGWIGSLLNLLRAIEWAGTRDDGEPVCPSCRWLQTDGHSPDCHLRRELDRR